MSTKSRLALISGPSALLVAASFASAGGRWDSDGFSPLFNGRDLSGWKVPEGDGGHWKVVDGVIDYDAQSEAKGDKNLWTERNSATSRCTSSGGSRGPRSLPHPYILPDGSYKKDDRGKEIKTPRPNADSGIFLRGDGHR